MYSCVWDLNVFVSYAVGLETLLYEEWREVHTIEYKKNRRRFEFNKIL